MAHACVLLHLIEVVVIEVIVFVEISTYHLFVYICPARHWLITQFACAIVLT